MSGFFLVLAIGVFLIREIIIRFALPQTERRCRKLQVEADQERQKLELRQAEEALRFYQTWENILFWLSVLLFFLATMSFVFETGVQLGYAWR